MGSDPAGRIVLDFAAEHENPHAGNAAEPRRVGERVGADGQPGPAGQLERNRGRNGAAIKQNRAVLRDELRGSPTDRGPSFRISGIVCHQSRSEHAGARGPAVHDIEMPLIGQQLEVAPYGLVGHLEDHGELGHAHRSGSAQAADDFIVSADREGAWHRLPKGRARPVRGPRC